MGANTARKSLGWKAVLTDCASAQSKQHNVCWLQDELNGEAKENKRDAARVEKHHAKWAQAQDARDMEAVVGAMRSGWRRPGRNGGLEGDLVRRTFVVSFWQSDHFVVARRAPSQQPVRFCSVGAGTLPACAGTGTGQGVRCDVYECH